MKPGKFFITGTDTDCGKTHVTCCLIDYFRSMSLRIEALKPVASGCNLKDDELISADASLLAKGSSLSLEVINPWRFRLPVSPHLAACQEGVQLEIQTIKSYCLSSQFNVFDVLLIEGAGGLKVPLNQSETWVDFLESTGIPIILVVGMRLGCINHALLTEHLIVERKLAHVGWIANFMDPNLLLAEEVLETLKDLMQMPYLGQVAYQSDVFTPSLPLHAF